MGRRGEILLLDSDEEGPNPSPPRPLHAAEGSRELQQSLTTGGSEKNPVVLFDSSLTAESEDAEEVEAGGSTELRLAPSAGCSRKHRIAPSDGCSRKHRIGLSAGCSRKHRIAPSAGGSRKHLLGLSAGGSRNRQDVVAASGSTKRRRSFSDGEWRKHHVALSAGGSRKRRRSVSDAGSRKRHHASRKELRKLAKSYIATGHTTVSTVELTMIKDFLASVFPVYDCADGTSSVLVHALTDTDVKKKQMKIPRRAVPDDLAISGPGSVVFHPDVTVEGSYNVLTVDDGRVRISCWKNFIDKVGWKAKTKIVMLFCGLDDMTWLFVHPLKAVVMA